jgi:hypothetical protein
VFPTESQYWLTPVPAVQLNVTDALDRVDPGTGVVRTGF